MQKTARSIYLILCISMVSTALGCASAEKKETPGRYIDDSLITGRVKTAILRDQELKVFQINVETFRGIVQLSGFVDSRKSVRKAEEVARTVEGVKEVRNDLIVR